MNYKQKYEEALEKGRRVHRFSSDPTVIMSMEDIFPELKESEDERMIKSFKRLIDAYYDVNFPTPEGFERKDMIAWLEKQGEQKPSDKVEPKFKVGDYIERKDGLGCHAKIICIGENVYGCEKLIYPEDSSPFFDLMFENQDEFRVSSDFQQKPSWSKEDEQNLNGIVATMEEDAQLPKDTIKRLCNWLKSIKGRIQPKQEWSEDDENHVKSMLSTIECCKVQFPNSPAVVEAYNADAEWIKSIKDRVQPLQKQEWSEEDEKMKSLIIRTLTSMGTLNLERYHNMNLDEVKNWLKSLKLNRWKPSEEQMKAIKYFIDFHRPQANASTEGWKEFKHLESLYNDLKKL